MIKNIHPFHTNGAGTPISTIDKSRIIRKLGTLDTKTISLVLEALEKMFS